MLFSNKNDENSHPKKRSVWGSLFNPRFGDDIRPMGDSLRFLSQLLASMFAANGLFPKDHPALQDPNSSVSFGEVVATAWSHLRWTKENAPQIVFFAAVMGCLGFFILFILTLFFSLLAGQAHAAGESYFTSPNPNCELAYQWLDYLFLNKPVYNSACPLNSTSFLIAPTGTSGLQSAFQAALAFYSRGMLICAGFLLIYHLVVMIAETAHSGKFMGRANQVWAPIRLVVAIGLLVPISTGAGLNLGQYLVVSVARWGSALASQTWALVVDKAVGNEGVGGLDLTIPPPPHIVDVVNDILLMNACKDAYNATLAKAGLSNSDYTIVRKDTNPICPGYEPTYDFESGVYVHEDAPTCPKYVFESKNGKVFCGSFILPTSPDSSAIYPRGDKDYAVAPQIQSVIEKLYTGHVKTIQKIITSPDFDTASQGIFSMEKMKAYTSSDFSPMSLNEIVKKRNEIVTNYRKELASQFKSIKGSTNIDKEQLLKWTGQGWVTAGAWFNTIARAQGAIYSGAESPIPQTTQPLEEMGDVAWYNKLINIFTEPEIRPSLSSSGEVTRDALREFKAKVIDVAYGEKDTQNSQVAQEGLPNTHEMPRSGWPTAAFFWGVNKLGVLAGLWPAGDGLTFQFGASSNPMAELIYFGYASTHTGLSILGWSGVTMATAKLVGGAVKAFGGKTLGLDQLVGAAASFGFFIGLLFLGMGLTLAFMLPLIPFIKFFFNVLTWVIIVLEAVVGIPLWALAHLTPYGDGFAGNQAQRGYQFLFSLLLRPVLLVLGLIAGFLFFFVAINFLNVTFSVAAAGSGSMGGALAVVGKIMFSILYVVLAYICANKCFQTISFFAEHGMNWFNGASLAGKQMGDQGKTTGALAMASGYLGSQTIGKVQELMGGLSAPGEAIGAAKTEKKVEAEKNAGVALAAQRHDDNMRAQGMRLQKVENPYTGLMEDRYMPDPGANLIASAGEEGAASSGGGDAGSFSSAGGSSAQSGGASSGGSDEQPTIVIAGANNPRDPKTQKEKERIRKENEAQSRSGRSNTDGNKA